MRDAQYLHGRADGRDRHGVVWNGRFTSGPHPAAAVQADGFIHIDVMHLQSMSRDLPELRVDTPY